MIYNEAIVQYNVIMLLKGVCYKYRYEKRELKISPTLLMNDTVGDAVEDKYIQIVTDVFICILYVTHCHIAQTYTVYY